MKDTLVGTEIVERVADNEGVDPVDLDVQLYDAVDADALEALMNDEDGRRTQANLHVEFSYHGYTIAVDGSEGIVINEQPIVADTDESSSERKVDG